MANKSAHKFPYDLESSEEDAKQIFEYYNKLALEIANAADNPTIEKIISNFRLRLNTEGQIITQGKHFNMQHLIAAVYLYEINYDKLGHYGERGSWDKHNAFSTKIIGYIQRQMNLFHLSESLSRPKSNTSVYLFDNGFPILITR